MGTARRAQSPADLARPAERPPGSAAAGPGWKGISGSVLAAAGVVVDAEGCVHLPCRSLAGEVLRERVVDPDGRRWWGPGDGIHLLGVEQLADLDPATPVLIAEGESDVLAAREHLPEFVSLGCPGASAWRPEWAVLVEDFPLVYVVGDGDEAGRRFAWSVRCSAPWVRPIVCPPGRDLRDLLQAGELETVGAMFAEADWMARLGHAVFEAPDLATAEGWLAAAEGSRG